MLYSSSSMSYAHTLPSSGSEVQACWQSLQTLAVFVQKRMFGILEWSHGLRRRFTQFHTRQAHKLFHLRTVMTCADLVAGVIPKLWAARDPQQLYWTPVSARFLWCASVLWWATFIPVHPGHKFSWFFGSFSLSSKIYCRMCDYVSRIYLNHFFLGQGSGKKVRKENFEAYHRTCWPLCYFNGMMRIIASSAPFFK